MAEPTTSTAAAAVATLTGAAPAISVVQLFGVNMGLRPDVLVAGFAGALVAIVLLNSVPSDGDTWQHLLESTLKRMFVAMASSLTAGYLTPLFLFLVLPSTVSTAVVESLLLPAAFVSGAGAQRLLRWAIDRFSPSKGSGLQPPKGDAP